MESIYEKSVRLAKQDNPDGNPQAIKNSTKHYFAHFFKLRNGIKSIGRTEGKLVLNK
jgi:hypothetical protein